MRNELIILGSVIVAAGVIRTMTRPKLKYFKASEFGVWYPLMSRDLLVKLDAFREAWGSPVIISTAHGGIGREDTSDSQHNVLRWGEVRAIDVFPMVGGNFMTTAFDRARARAVATSVGFTGIGLYADTSPGNMLHVDVRKDRREARPAEWSRVAGQYLGIERVLA